MQSTPILTVQSANALLDVLEDFLDKSEANFAMVIERGGSVLSQCGAIPADTDTSIVAALAAGNVVAGGAQFAVECGLAGQAQSAFDGAVVTVDFGPNISADIA